MTVPEFCQSRGVAEGDDQTLAAQNRRRGRLQRQTLGSQKVHEFSASGKRIGKNLFSLVSNSKI